MPSGLALLAVAASGLLAALVVGLLVPRPPRLAGRVRPYAVGARTRLGLDADVGAQADPGPLLSGGTMRQLLAPVLGHVLRAGMRVTHREDDVLAQRLAQAGLYPDVPTAQRVQEHRIRQLSHGLGLAVALGGVGALTGRGAALSLALAALGAVAGVSRVHGRVERTLSERRERIRIELYTVNQLLALHVRVGGGVVQALQFVTGRGRGEVVDELRQVLRHHRGGRPIAEALEHAAARTPEPNAARTYRLLAAGVTYGTDLGEGLRALSDDVREERAETLKRAATRRRAGMLLPIVAILAPVMLLFIAAPLPSIVLGGR